EGIVPGGGIGLLRAGSVLRDLAVKKEEEAGVKVVQRACEVPLHEICANADENAAEVTSKVLKSKKKSYGFDVTTGQYADLFEVGILDPTKVIRLALETAAIYAINMLTTEGLVHPSLSNRPQAGHTI
nr:chaperonin GroEL [Nitrospirales bacterium]